jgi:predicted transcriptional regulator
MKRSFFAIITEILKVAKNGAKKTRIMYSCTLSYRMTGNFLNYLLNVGLLVEGNSFHTTEKGLRFLRAYQTLELLLNSKVRPGAKRRKG